MFDVKNVEIEWAGRKLKLETGKIARQADSTVIATYGGTIGQLDLYFIKILKMRLKLLVLYYHMIKKMTQML